MKIVAVSSDVERFEVGDSVKLITKNARRGMGSVKVGDIGTIRATDGACSHFLISGLQSLTVDFPAQAEWKGYGDEFEIVPGNFSQAMHHDEFKKTSQISFLEKNFDFNSAGLIVFKTFNEQNAAPPYWDIKAGSILEERVDFSRGTDCSIGINVGTSEWVKNNTWRDLVWEGLVRWPWLAGVSVPNGSGGKIRVERLELRKSYTRDAFLKK